MKHSVTKTWIRLSDAGFDVSRMNAEERRWNITALIDLNGRLLMPL